MKTTQIERDDWPEFFDRVSRALQGKQIEIEIDAADIGAQVEGKSLSLNGLSYDRKDDIFVVAAEVIEHLVRAPRQIFVSGDEDAIDSLEVAAADGSRHIVTFREPLALPAGAG